MPCTKVFKRYCEDGDGHFTMYGMMGDGQPQ